jgi:NodT family efflux transporter outer membrane factor (OMF) lipoprotein
MATDRIMMGGSRSFLWAGLGALALSLGGCTVGPNFKAPSVFSPASWFDWHGKPTEASRAAAHASLVVARPIDTNWWNLFRDPTLTSLERRVAGQNLDVRLATVRLAESRAQRSVVGSDQYPQLNGNASYTREKASQKGILGLGSAGGASAGSSSPGTAANGQGAGAGGIPGSTVFEPFNLWQYGFDASWELDLWGRVRREVESADASVEASAEARRAALLSVIAEVARDYIQLRGVQRNLQITQENLKTAQDSLRLTQQRYAGGLTSDLDVANASAQVASVEAQIPRLQQQEAELINALSLLLAEPPGALQAELAETRPIPPVPPTVPVGIPSELARRRPDIVQAEDQLHSATADIGVAVADFYPRITLSGSVSLQALQFKDLGNWDARQYALGPSLTLPIFQGGRIRATVKLRKAQAQEAALKYQQTVLQAWHEVDNALTAYDAEQRRRDRLAAAVRSNQQALNLARARYQEGIADFLQVLDAQRNLLAAEQQYAESTTTVSTNLVALYKALGGGWEGTFPREAPRVQQANR